MSIFRHAVAVRRYSSSVDDNFTPNGTSEVVANLKGYVHEYMATELPNADALGQKTIGHGLFAYKQKDVNDDPFAFAEQDLLDVTFRDGTQKTFRVVARRDNHIMQRLDLERVV